MSDIRYMNNYKYKIILLCYLQRSSFHFECASIPRILLGLYHLTQLLVHMTISYGYDRNTC